jgi:hypothetical protein
VDEVEATGPYHIRYGSRFQLVLRRAVAAITHVARRPLLSIYGGSYFGSGGGYGVVRTSGNCRAVGLVDNGFMAGPAAVEVSDPAVKARYYAVGGDCIGDVREWGEAGEWDPAARRWSDVPGVHRRTKTERLAWLAEVDVPSEDAARREAELDAS